MKMSETEFSLIFSKLYIYNIFNDMQHKTWTEFHFKGRFQKTSINPAKTTFMKRIFLTSPPTKKKREKKSFRKIRFSLKPFPTFQYLPRDSGSQYLVCTQDFFCSLIVQAQLQLQFQLQVGSWDSLSLNWSSHPPTPTHPWKFIYISFPISASTSP